MGWPAPRLRTATTRSRLALRGYVVLAPDLRCFGERADWNPPDHYACDTNLVHAVMAGESPLAQNLWDMARSLDLLVEGHPLVDPGSHRGRGPLLRRNHLSVPGRDGRAGVRRVVSGYMSSWAEAHKMPWNMCGSQVLPGMLGQARARGLGALVAPRPMLVESGRRRRHLSVAGSGEDGLRGAPGLRGLGRGPGSFVHDVFDGGHQWHGERLIPSWLAGSPDSIFRMNLTHASAFFATITS